MIAGGATEVGVASTAYSARDRDFNLILLQGALDTDAFQAGKKYGEVLGVHIIGPSASDLIPEGVLALQLEATLEDIANTIHAHPTLGEGSMEAALVRRFRRRPT